MDRIPFVIDPVYGGPDPLRPRPNRKAWNKQIVWPRDKKQKGAHSWRRWKDIFTNKGPDMWLTSRGGSRVHRPVWSGWNQEGRDNLGYHYRNDNQGPPLKGAYRPEWQRYDFRKRRYRMPDIQTWSDVKWSRKGRTPLYTRGPFFMDEWVNPEYYVGWDNPFAWHQNTPYWDWRHDDIFNPLFDER